MKENMMRKIETLTAAILLTGLFCRPASAQSAPATIITVEIENWVEYNYDTPDPTKWATSPNITPASPPKNFGYEIGIADVVAVNGQPVKGTMIRNTRYMTLSATPNPGQAIGDAPRGALTTDYFEILKTDGTPIGTITVTGILAGPPPPGAPLAVVQGNFTIVGGTGAFLGVRGQSGNGAATQPTTLRKASIVEDPANRRLNGGGGKVHWVMNLIPRELPAIMTTPNGPAVVHSSDFSLVTSTKPAAAGEVLSVFATGLGPTKPGVDPGKPFPATPPAVVNSPIGVTVNGQSAEVLGAVGYPGTVDGYQLNFRIPPGTAKGMASVQVSSAWIAGAEVKIAIQ
jgi:hypothetical protein